MFVLHQGEDGRFDDQKWDRLLDESNEDLSDMMSLFSNVHWDSYQDALNGHAMPLIQELGLPPHRCLQKAHFSFSECVYKEECPSYNEDTCYGHKDPPLCYNPSYGEEDENDTPFAIRDVISTIYRYWHKDIWIVTVKEDTFR
jgi:hypothetical protein